MSHDDLLKRLREADGFDRALDREIGFALDGWRLQEVTGYLDTGPAIVTGDGDVYVDAPGGMYPSYTESLDEAIGLVERMLPGANIDLFRRSYGSTAFVYRGGKTHAVIEREAIGPTPALALLIALLEALNAQEQSNA